jgi:ribose transport system substrate-binding protein
MKNQIFKLIAVCLFLSIVFSGCVKNKKDSSSQEGEQSLKIAVIPKGTTHEFWKAIHAGAMKASMELNVEIIWKGSQKEDDRAQQITVVEDFVNRGVDGIVLAPLDDRALLRPVKDKGGVLAARAMGRLLPGGGKIFLIRYQEGSASTTKREQGFLDTIQKEFPEIEFLVQNLYAGASTETAFQFAENMLNRFPEVEGVFCPNESTTFGALRALQESRLAGKVVFIGFDSSPKLVQALREGHIQGLVLQNPIKIGYLGVKQIVFHLRGQTIPKRVDTGVYLATPNNVDDPEIRSLLAPDFAKYLDR